MSGVFSHSLEFFLSQWYYRCYKKETEMLAHPSLVQLGTRMYGSIDFWIRSSLFFAGGGYFLFISKLNLSILIIKRPEPIITLITSKLFMYLPPPFWRVVAVHLATICCIQLNLITLYIVCQTQLWA